MAGNSQRRGAVRKSSKKTAGSGGRGKQALEGRGPTPKAVDREYHAAHKRAKAATQRAASGGGRAGAGARAGGRSAASGRGGGSRAKASSEMVAGRNSVVEALRAHIPVSQLFVASRIDVDDRVREALKTAAERGLPVMETTRTELDRLTDGAVHQGLALQMPPYEYSSPRDLIDPQRPGVPVVVALDGITDPRNLGAIIRSVAAFGGHGVVVPERRSVGMTASAWKTSAGAAARVPVAKAGNLRTALEEFKKAGFFVLGLDMAGDVELPEIELASEPIVIVTGSEGKGLSRLVRETCDQIVSIPMDSAVESLNAGLATGVALYEVARSRRAARRG